MHPACADWDGCECECHQQCEVCGKQCRKVFAITGGEHDGREACAACFKANVRASKSLCEVCGAPFGYRDPRSGDQRYLCASDHLAAGHGIGRQAEAGARWAPARERR